MLTVLEVLALADERAKLSPSAKLCVKDAKHLYAIGNDEAARKRAIDSLRYSVGIFGEDYAKATA